MPEPMRDGYTPEQRLFLELGRGLASKGARRRCCCSGWRPTRTPPLSSAATRSSATCHEFYAAFDVAESDALWLDEEQRVKIW